ncbi:hypothetical protein NBC2815_00694 [Xanthomonas fragariae]|nr:hypothetical protein NBC2815_00694 [Xanthomonas fragariae]
MGGSSGSASAMRCAVAQACSAASNSGSYGGGPCGSPGPCGLSNARPSGPGPPGPGATSSRTIRRMRRQRHALARQASIEGRPIQSSIGRGGVRPGSGRWWQGNTLFLRTAPQRSQSACTRQRWRRTAMSVWWRWCIVRRAAQAGAASQAQRCKQCGGNSKCRSCLDHRRSPWMDGARAYKACTCRVRAGPRFRESLACGCAAHLPLHANRWHALIATLQLLRSGR